MRKRPCLRFPFRCETVRRPKWLRTSSSSSPPRKRRRWRNFSARTSRSSLPTGTSATFPARASAWTASNDYQPSYELLAGKEKTINDLKRAVKSADNVFLAADPDREGEAISWHLQEALKPGAARRSSSACASTRSRRRPSSRRSTTPARSTGAASTRSRPAASSTASSATRSRTCSGRRSGAASPPVASRRWRCGSSSSARTRSRPSSRSSTGRSTRRSEGRRRRPSRRGSSTFDGEKLKFDGSDPRLAERGGRQPRARRRRRRRLEGRVGRGSERRKNPAPPFTTSQLQQAAARRLGFAVRRTMKIAQRLYEGREIAGHGTVGLITYMRTDSTRVSQEALTAVREHIGATVRRSRCPSRRASSRTAATRRTRTRRSARRTLDLPPEEVAAPRGRRG